MAKKQLDPYTLEKEESIKKFWLDNKISDKARQLNADSSEKYYFMDGPPYATGHIHMGTALNKILKDIAMRSKRMQGFDVFDRPGYDTHGLPIEHAIEKELGFKNKKDIEDFGVKEFVDKCRTFATRFIDTMNDEFKDLGVWMDWDNPYLTLNNDYVEAIWYSFKKAHEKGLLYLDKYSVHVCPRCATAVAYNEIEYHKQKDTSVYVKFPLKDEENKFLVIWTTTPWTLPANMGVMVHPDFDYVEAKLSSGAVLIVAKERLEQLMNSMEAGYSVVKEFKGKELEGKHYTNPLAVNLKLPDLGDIWRVILSERYVNLEEGTGLVHTAPGHGKEDYDAGKKSGLPVFCPVGIDGLFDETAGKYAGTKARVVDVDIIKDLEDMGNLLYKHSYTHDYPFCWRCKDPLIMIATPQWFFAVTKIREKMLELNNDVSWVPDWMQDRMKNWLESLGDWPVSRNRYWGSPLPIWTCECGERKVYGSIEELSKDVKLPENLDLHKPEIDNIKVLCNKCGKEMSRVPEVLDVWFDSGVSSWAALGYPHKKDLFEKFWPANINIEGTDQVRGWWNSQLITSTICFDEAPFNNIAVHGMVLDVSKKKMSKSLGNIVKPSEVIAKYNRDYLRYFLASESKGVDFSFDWNAFKEIHKFFNILWNTYNFANLYLDLDATQELDKNKLEMEDLWILSKLYSLADEVTNAYNSYKFYKALELLNSFVVEDFSRTYIKLIRNRIGTETGDSVRATVNHTLQNLLKLLAPVTPHITEFIYQDLKKEGMPESIHLQELPVVDNELMNKDLEKEMDLVKDLTQVALSLREENKLRLRWPLNRVVVEHKTSSVPNLKNVLATMANVKSVEEVSSSPSGNFASKEFNDIKVHIDLDASVELKEEWELMELRRRIQDKRKQAKCNPNDTIEVYLDCSDKNFLEKYKAQIEKDTNTKVSVKSGSMEKVLDREFYIELNL